MFFRQPQRCCFLGQVMVPHGGGGCKGWGITKKGGGGGTTITVCLLATRRYDAIHGVCLADSGISVQSSLSLSLLSLLCSALCHLLPSLMPSPDLLHPLFKVIFQPFCTPQKCFEETLGAKGPKEMFL